MKFKGKVLKVCIRKSSFLYSSNVFIKILVGIGLEMGIRCVWWFIRKEELFFLLDCGCFGGVGRWVYRSSLALFCFWKWSSYFSDGVGILV